MVSYHSALAVGGYRSESICALSADMPSKQESGIKILLKAKQPTCPTGLFPKCAGQTSFKQLIQGMRLNLILQRRMSVVGPDDIKDGDCERGKVTQRPPISYAQFKYPKWLTEPDNVKIRLPKGNQYTCDLMNDASNAKTYSKWIQVYLRVLGEKELRAPLDAATGVCRKLLENFKKFSKAPKKEVTENKAVREVELAATKVKLVEVTAIQVIAIQACYDLFRQLLADDPRDQWDRIVREVH